MKTNTIPHLFLFSEEIPLTCSKINQELSFSQIGINVLSFHNLFRFDLAQISHRTKMCQTRFFRKIVRTSAF